GEGLDTYDNAIVSLTTDAHYNLWAVSRNCILVFDSLRRFRRAIRSGLTRDQVTQNRANFTEKVWPLSSGDVLVRLHDAWRICPRGSDSTADTATSPELRRLAFLSLLDSAPPMPAGFVSSRLFKVFDRYFLLLHGDSLLLFDESGRECSRRLFRYNSYPYTLWSQRIAAVDSAKILLLFHNYGLAILSLRWRGGTPVLDSISQPLLEDRKYTSALRDDQGNWWLATIRDGLKKIVPGRQCFTGITLLGRSSGTPIKYEATSFSSWGHRLWIATYGEGFFSVDETTGRQQQHRLQHTRIATWADFTWNVRQVDADTLWVGTQTGLFWYSLSSHSNGRMPPYPGKPAELDQVAVTTQFRDSHGLVWMGLGKGKGVCCFDSASRRFYYYRGNSPDGYPLRYPLAFAEDGKGDLWVVSDASNDLVRWHRASGRFAVIPLPATDHQHIGALNGMTIEGDSVLWLSSLTCGLVRFVPSTKSVTVFGHDNGLVNSFTGSLFEDSAGRIWLATEGGLACFNRSTETFLNYTEANGLPMTWLTAAFLYDRVTRRLYNGGHGGYFYFNPAAIAPDGHVPRPLITSVSVNGNSRSFDTDSLSTFHAGENDITIRYAAVDLADGPSIRYAWRLVGADTGWMPAGKQRQINFSHLPPGRYTFLVRAATGNGVWNPAPAAFAFQIDPPFTRTGWFYALLLIGIASVAWSFYRYRIRQQRQSRQIRAEISRNLHDEVGANLTNISLSSLLARRQLHNDVAVGQLLERIYQDSQQVSESMREIVWSIDPDIETLGEALPRMLHYASGLLEARDIELKAVVEPEVEQLKLDMQERRDLYLIFKEAVNNMARHSKATQAWVRFLLGQHALVMTIHD
ncbi:MAG TPA: triple tyrosine motif-containing protein, partial [Puia sp.]|nr:triple tyrosine motif-containing protein [Puia sp.]